MKIISLSLSLALFLSSCCISFVCKTSNCDVHVSTCDESVKQCIVVDSELYNPDPEIRKAALARTSSPNAINEVALKDSDPEIRKMALQKTSSLNTINQVALKDCDPEIRKMALAKTSSINTINDVALKDSDPEIRELARKRLNRF